MTEIQVDGRTVNAYLATPEQGSGPGVLVLHAWWGLTDVFKRVCNRLAEAGFVALAPDLYQGKTTTSIEEAQTLARTLDEERARKDIAGAVKLLREHSNGKLAVIGFSLGGAYGLELSVDGSAQIAAAVVFYTIYGGLDYSQTAASYLFHLAENDLYEPIEQAAQMEQELQTAGKAATFYTYPATSHWFVEENRPEYNAEAAELAWERTLAFLHQHLDS